MMTCDDGTPTGDHDVVPFERFEEHRLKLERLRRKGRGLPEGDGANDEVAAAAVRSSTAGSPDNC